MKAFIKILVLVAVVVIVLVLIKKLSDQGESVSDATAITKLLDIVPEEIVGLQVIGLNAEYSLSRVSGRFRMAGVLEIDDVNQEAVAGVLETVANVYPVEEFSADVPDGEINLGGYEILKVSANGNREYEIRVGDQPLTNDTRAVKILLNGNTDGTRYRIQSDDYAGMFPLRSKLLK